MNKNTEFSFETIENFDDHITRSIPNYNSIGWLIQSLSTHFIEEGTNVYEIGSSTGRLLRRLASDNDIPDVSYIGYDISRNLLVPENSDSLSLFIRDVTDPTLKLFNTNLVISVFTLQFISRFKRQLLVDKIYDSLNDGGAFIVSEKTISELGVIQDIFNKSYYEFKRIAFDSDEIFEKEDVLRTIMRPLTSEQNVQLFKEAGFKIVSEFWRGLNFVSYICIK